MAFGVVASAVPYDVNEKLIEVVHISQCFCFVGFAAVPRSPNFIVTDFIHRLE